MPLLNHDCILHLGRYHNAIAIYGSKVKERWKHLLPP